MRLLLCLKWLSCYTNLVYFCYIEQCETLGYTQISEYCRYAENFHPLWAWNFPRNRNAAIIVPTNGAVQYNHKSPSVPDSNAGASARAGFIDATESSTGG